MKIKATAHEKYWVVEMEGGRKAHTNCSMTAAIIIRGFLCYVNDANHADIDRNAKIEDALRKTYSSGPGSTFEIDAYKGETIW